MAEEPVRVPPPSAEQRRVAAERFDRARQVVATENYDYGIQLLLACCKLDPANLLYRRELRRAQKAKHKGNLKGGFLSFFTTAPFRSKLRAAKRKRDYLKILEHGEEILARNPWDVSAQMEMGAAADALGLIDMAIFILDQAREKDANSATVNRALARLFEKRGNFAQAIKLWEKVRQLAPHDVEAAHKGKDLAASETIQRGQYESNSKSEEPGLAVLQQQRASGVGDRTAGEMQALETKIADDPTSPQPHLDLATKHRKAGQPDKALAVLRAAMGPTGNNFQIALQIAELELEPFRKNLSLTEAKIKAHPADEELRTIRADLVKEINTRELDLCRMKADRHPNDANNRLDLGIRLMRVGAHDEAIQELQQARKEPRLLWRAALNLGHCFDARHNWRLAQRNYEEALKHLPANDEEARKDLLFHLAKGHAGAGDFARAVEIGHELANLDFGYRDVGKLCDEWQKQLQIAPVKGR